jgi:hypothetical protein
MVCCCFVDVFELVEQSTSGSSCRWKAITQTSKRAAGLYQIPKAPLSAVEQIVAVFVDEMV